MNILMIGAHPDDCDFQTSGTARKFVKAGHTVRFLSVCDGSGGHQSMGRREIAARRAKEIQEAAKVIGVEYDVWDVPDCDIEPTLALRQRMIRYIRAFNPDMVFAHRTNDYHADHRAVGMLVQDASYMLIVPNECPDVPAMRKMPVILSMDDNFTNPPFRPDVVVDIDDTIEDKFRMIDKHVSQMYEWLPYTRDENKGLETVPDDPAERFEWLHTPRVDANTTDEELLQSNKFYGYMVRFARPAARYRKQLIERYGAERGAKVRFAEAFEVSEYGAPMTKEMEKELFPF